MSGFWARPKQRPVPQLHTGWAWAIVRAARGVTPLEKLMYSVLLDFDRKGRGMFTADTVAIADELGCGGDYVPKLLRSLMRNGLAHRETVRTTRGDFHTYYPTLPFTLDSLPVDRKQQRRWRQDWTALLDQHVNATAKSAATDGEICREPQRELPREAVPTSAAASPSALLDVSLDVQLRKTVVSEVSPASQDDNKTDKQRAPQGAARPAESGPARIGDLMPPEYQDWKRRQAKP